ncbi:MAG: hypothetical protein HZA30_03980 [Candidatus Omnitrophica bacterium]|nr:hypothetical protein [Candidatus Omnitrophota bacterium]
MIISGKMTLATTVMLLFIIAVFTTTSIFAQEDDTSRQILKQGLLGAGTGAIAAGASGGKAGQGALIGAGTAVIGSALLDSLTGPSSSQRRAAPPPDEEYYYADEPEAYYEAPPQESGSTRILKQGLIGAGTGAIAAGASGGKAGQGALIGAGTAVVGNALLDTLTQPPAQRRGRVYRRIPTQKVRVQEEEEAGAPGTRKKIIRKYDESGKVVSEEEIYY